MRAMGCEKEQSAMGGATSPIGFYCAVLKPQWAWFPRYSMEPTYESHCITSDGPFRRQEQRCVCYVLRYILHHVHSFKPEN